nr:Actin-crosslinking domain protein [Parasacculina yatsui]
MSEYSSVRCSKLKLKGTKLSSSKSKKTVKKRKLASESVQEAPVDPDATAHGGWWSVSQMSDLKGIIAIEMTDNCYIKALDNGLFILGAPHKHGEGPDPEEMFTVVPVNDTRLALKSGYGKYLGVGTADRMVGRADAVGPREQWEPIFQDGQAALMGANSRFVTVGEQEDDQLMVTADTAGPPEMLHFRSCASRCQVREVNEDEGNLNKVELNYVKRFQKFQDKRLRINASGALELKEARDQGRLHEKLLDRRSGMKSDRYCK